MEIKSAKFVKSSPSFKDLPEGNFPELAFIGRSNVGKSSLLNYLVGYRDLARTSSKPGRTKLINHFLINEAFYFVDLPGYGFAKSSKTDREKWGRVTEEFLLNSPRLRCVFVLLDFSIFPQVVDLEFLSWLRLKQIPFAVVLTKTDKPNQSTRYKQTQLYYQELAEILDSGTQIFEASSIKKKGRMEILTFIQKLVSDD